MLSKGLLAWWPVAVGLVAMALLVSELLSHSADRRRRSLAFGIGVILVSAVLSAVVRLSGVQNAAIHLAVDVVMLGAMIFAFIQFRRADARPKGSDSPS